MNRLVNVLICRATPLSPEPRVDKIAASLKTGGYRTMVVGWNITGDLPDEEEIYGVPYIRLPVKARFGHGIKNIRHVLRWQLALAKFIFNHRKEINLIHACDFDTVIPALMAKWFWGKKVIYDIFDFYADMLQNTPVTVKKVIRWLDCKLIGFVDGVVLADSVRVQQIQRSHPKQLAFIYNCPEDEAVFIPKATESSASLRISYVGALRHERGLQILLNVLQNHQDWHLDLAGFGSDEDYYHHSVMGKQNITWHGRVPYHKGLQLSAEADVLLVTYDPVVPNNQYASANKLFEAMMLGKPVIVARGTHMDHIVEDHQCGWVVDYGDRVMLEASLLDVYSNHSLRLEYGANARKAYESLFNWPVMARRLLGLYGEITNA